MYWCDAIGDNVNCSKRINIASSPVERSPDPLGAVLIARGLSYNTYTFNAPINAQASVSQFWFEVDEGNGSGPKVHDNDGSRYFVAQDKVIHIPSGTSTVFAGYINNNLVYNTTVLAAVRTSLEVKLLLFFLINHMAGAIRHHTR